MSLRDQLPSQWEGKPNVEGVVDAFDNAGTRVDDDVDARLLELRIDTATEAEIDEYLRLVGPSRAQIDAAIRANTTNAAALPIDRYRRVAKGAGAASRSSGSIEDLYVAWTAINPDVGVFAVTPFSAAQITLQHGVVESSGDADVDESFDAATQLIMDGAAPLGVIVTLDLLELPPGGETFDVVYSAPTPTSLWTWQEASAPVVDQNGSNDMTEEKGTPTYQVGAEFGRVAVELTAAATTPNFIGSDANIGDASVSQSASAWARLNVPATVGAKTVIFDKWASGETGNGWSLAIGTAGELVLRTRDDGGVVDEDTIGSVDLRGTWVNVAIAFDHVAGEVRVYWSGASSPPVSGTSTFANFPAANASAMRVGMWANSSSFAAFDIAYVAAWDGHALTQAEFDEFAAATAP